MRILVTGGTGVIGAGLIPELLARGHQVRLLSRGAEGKSGEYPDGVETRAGDVTKADSLRGAVDGCDAIVHVTGIAEEDPPHVTFAEVNVRGTANVLAEAERSGRPRFIYLSSLGAERGSSAYHASKREAETLVRGYEGPWLILRPGNVFGPGDEVVSLIVRMVRSLPAVPLVGMGDQPFQPVWYEDLGRGIAAAAERSDLSGAALDLAGGETTTMRDLVERIADLTNRDVAMIPVPTIAASLVAGLTGLAGVEFPLTESKLTMLLEENRIPEGSPNGLLDPLGVEPTALGEALGRLIEVLPETLPDEGVGSLERKRFRADIHGARVGAEALIADLRRNFAEVMPIDFAVEGEDGDLREGETITGTLPARGHIQVRVESIEADRIVLATVEGHPIAGVVSFQASELASVLRFEIEVDARAASWWDWMTLMAGGSAAQNWNWREVVRRVVERSGGEAPEGVQTSDETLEGDEASRMETGIRTMVEGRKREEAGQLSRERRDR